VLHATELRSHANTLLYVGRDGVTQTDTLVSHRPHREVVANVSECETNARSERPSAGLTSLDNQNSVWSEWRSRGKAVCRKQRVHEAVDCEHDNSPISLPTASGVLREAQYRLSGACICLPGSGRRPRTIQPHVSDVARTAMVYTGW